jgi:hypothetical protein
MNSMKKSSFVFILLGFSLGHIPNFGVLSVQPASAQVFRCSDTTLGQDGREEVRREDSRSESKVVVGADCRDANFYEHINEINRRNAESLKEQMRRNAESRKESDAAFDKRRQRRSCEFYGIRSSECTDPELKRQAQQEDEINRQRQLQADQIRKEAEREETLRQNVKNARTRVQDDKESIVRWKDTPQFRERYEKMLPIHEAELQRTEQELKDYLAQKQK